MGLIFLIKITFIPVCSKKQSLDPGRGSPHLFADSIQGYIGAAFDDQFIMYMTADKAVGKGLHGISQDITAYCLDDVLHEFGSVAFNPSPFSSGRKQVYLRFRSQDRECICKMHVNEEIFDFRVPRSFQ